QSGDYSALTLKCINDPVLGSSEARNFGARFATARWIAFIDDDEKLPYHWVERTLEIISNKAPDIFGGPYHPYYMHGKPDWFKDQYLIQTLGANSQWVEDNRCLFGGSIVFKQAWFERLNGFSTQLGRTGHNKEYGEETEIQLRAHELGARFYYDPDLYIFHYVHPERLVANWYLSSGWYHGKAKAKITSEKSQQGISSFRYKLSLFRKVMLDILLVIRLYIGVLFRNQAMYPFRQNYIVERFAPAVSVLGMSWHLLRLSFKRLLAGSKRSK
ncbi:MAG: glycosyltransferase, partial [Saprospiraceae bacterium]|nr:glycosyltransferase [Saprospiraceae bacterium]